MFKLEFDLSCLNCCALITLSLIALLFICVDVHYFLRVIGTVLYGMYVQKSIDFIKDKCTVYGICTLSDLDFVLKHMNNARFLREMDFARISFYIRSGVHKIVTNDKGNIMQTATSIRYRKAVPLFSAYKITTRLIYWEENAFYLEHQFVTLRDGFVCAVVLSQQKVIGMQTNEVVKKVVKSDDFEVATPSEELAAWIQSMKISSEKLRKKL